MQKPFLRSLRPIAPLLLVVLLVAACGIGSGTAPSPDRASAGSGPADALKVPTWPDASSTLDPGVSAIPAGPAAVSGAASGGLASGAGNPGGGPTGTAAGLSAATDPTVLALERQVDRALQELGDALDGDASSSPAEGGLP